MNKEALLQEAYDSAFEDELEKVALSENNKERIAGGVNVGLGLYILNMARKDLPDLKFDKAKSSKFLRGLIKYVGVPVGIANLAIGSAHLAAPEKSRKFWNSFKRKKVK